ncbi:hypothetical protein EVAR_75738_1 [Eumeta japonica]|uniref:Uncharacterized protein n=1 Tax=Eumeta variegata TaxID=151549 RepID=A0A4C1TFR0_EUMVA|nr:hypothetical protein EVAR_75738_1 [Eumeta japonica]
MIRNHVFHVVKRLPQFFSLCKRQTSHEIFDCWGDKEITRSEPPDSGHIFLGDRRRGLTFANHIVGGNMTEMKSTCKLMYAVRYSNEKKVQSGWKDFSRYARRTSEEPKGQSTRQMPEHHLVRYSNVASTISTV